MTSGFANPVPLADDGAMSLDVDKIRRLRTRLELSQAAAARSAGLPGGAPHWSRIESGKITDISLSTLERIAAALGVKARDLLR